MMTALILYDSSSLAAKANTLLQRAAINVVGLPGCNVILWRTQMLEVPRFFELAQNEAAEAQLVICAWHDHRPFSQWIQDWLELWILSRSCRNPAIALLGESDQMFFSRAAVKLREFSELSGISLIAGQRELPEDLASRPAHLHARRFNLSCATGS